MKPDNHNLPELPRQHDLTSDAPQPPQRPGDLPALLAILVAGLAFVLVGHLDITAAVTLLTAMVGLYGAYRRS